jgi:hypothetical protein
MATALIAVKCVQEKAEYKSPSFALAPRACFVEVVDGCIERADIWGVYCLGLSPKTGFTKTKKIRLGSPSMQRMLV